MTRVMSGQLHDVRHGIEPGAIEFTFADGHVFHVIAWGMHDDERRRTAEALLAAFRGAGILMVGG